MPIVKFTESSNLSLTGIVFGSLNMDLKAETVSRIADGASSTTGIFSASPGGKGANEAVALARLGVRTFLIGRVGKDEMGSVLLSRLNSIENLDTTCVARDTSVATGVAVQLVASNRVRALGIPTRRSCRSGSRGLNPANHQG